MKISVIICTHNPREDYLRRVLAALQSQTLAPELWELLLVDNASAKPLTASWDLSWQPNARHVREEKPGKTHALLRAVTEAKGELLLIVDDDNVLRADYLAAALKISAAYPWLGSWSGSCLPEFEVEPAGELRPWLEGLVIEKLTAPVWAKLRTITHACPAGAGMVVRREQALRYRELALHDPMRQLLGPHGKKPGAGDDGDMALCGFDLGLGMGRLPELELTHLIPARKLTLEYLENLNEGFGYAGVVLNAIYSQTKDFPGQMQNGALRIFLFRIFLFIMGKSRVERRIRLAVEKGRFRASQQLKQSGFLSHPAPGHKH